MVRFPLPARGEWVPQAPEPCAETHSATGQILRRPKSDRKAQRKTCGKTTPRGCSNPATPVRAMTTPFDLVVDEIKERGFTITAKKNIPTLSA